MKTELGPKLEKEIVDLLNPIIEKFVKKHRRHFTADFTPELVKDCVIYLWESETRDKKQEMDDYLSSREIGPYAGR